MRIEMREVRIKAVMAREDAIAVECCGWSNDHNAVGLPGAYEYE